jgi:hypothetical protein
VRLTRKLATAILSKKKDIDKFKKDLIILGLVIFKASSKYQKVSA